MRKGIVSFAVLHRFPTLLSLKTAHSVQGSRMSRQGNQNEPMLRTRMNALRDSYLQLIAAP